MKLRIRELREDRDLTQREVAAVLHCDVSLYSKYERGERAISLKAVMQLSQFYNTSMDYILGRVNDPRPYPPPKREE